MLGWLFRNKKRDVQKVREDTLKSFEFVKKDINSVNLWIKHLHQQNSKHEDRLMELDAKLASIETDIEGLKNVFALADQRVFKQLFKTASPVSSKQTGVQGVQIGVQTPVQTGVLYNISSFSITERAIISILLNSELKLSYDDLAAMLGKSRATMRGQMNSIKQKSEGLVEEIIEKNGKKRVFIPAEIKEKMLKNVKVRVGKDKKGRKKEENGVEYA